MKIDAGLLLVYVMNVGICCLRRYERRRFRMSILLAIVIIMFFWASPSMPLETKYLAGAIIVAGGLAGLGHD